MPRTPPRLTPRLTDVDWGWVRHMLAVRSGQRCEVTGTRAGVDVVWEVHHRQPRGAGGTSVAWIHDLGNLVLLTREAHHAVHAHPVAAQAAGFLVLHGCTAPWEIPLTLWSGRRVLLAATDPFYLTGVDPPYADPFCLAGSPGQRSRRDTTDHGRYRRG